MQVKSLTRVIGTMLLAHEYDNQDICIMGYPQDVSLFSFMQQNIYSHFLLNNVC